MTARGIRPARVWIYAPLLLALSGLTTAAPDDSCSRQARGEMEQLYCQIKAEGEGRSLPSLEDFRRNTPQIQALLLKRPAQALGLSLPATGNPPERSQPASGAAAVRQPAQPAPTASRAVPQQKQRSTPPTDSARNGPSLADCTLQPAEISCPGPETYSLITNQSNRLIDRDALQPENRMNLPQPRWDQENELTYLTRAYRHYIDKMLDIGLGGSTMSFTRFYHSYQDLKPDLDRFRERYETMFAKLKTDKLSIQPPALRSSEHPDSIEACEQLTSTLIVCDNGLHNWLYRRF